MGRAKSTAVAVCDAGPIIHLDELNSLDILSDFREIILSGTVQKEILQHRPSALTKIELLSIDSSVRYPVREDLFTMCRIFSLDTGETEALAIMEKNPSAIFFTDDASARLVADNMGFKVHGTIGLIIRSIRRGQKKPDQVLEILRDLPSKSTLYIKDALLENIILKLKNEFCL